jgi:hypothetical protein
MATQAVVDELRQKLAEEYARLCATVATLGEEQLRATVPDAEGEQQWSPLQQLAHMAEMHRFYDAWIDACLTADNPDLGTVEFGDWPPIMLEEAHEHSAGELLAALDERRAAVDALLSRISLAELDRPGTHPVMGTATVLQWMRSYYRHYRMHGDQIAGRPPAYEPRVVSGEPLNQRQLRIRLGRERFRALRTQDELSAAAEREGWPSQPRP